MTQALDYDPNLTPQQALAPHRPRNGTGRFRHLDEGQRLPTPHTDAQKSRYLDLLDTGASVREACEAIGIHTWQPWAWERDDPEFAQALVIAGHGIVGGILESKKIAGMAET